MYKALTLILVSLTLTACQTVSNGDQRPLRESTLSGNWVLSQWNGQAAEAAYGPANIQFSWQDDLIKVNGSNGCNLYFGNTEITDNQLQFGPLANTLRACPVPLMKQEQAFMQLLADPELKTQLGADTLQLQTQDQSFTFTRKQ